jgi:hypothetical protein
MHFCYFLAGLGMYSISKYTDFLLFPYNVGLAQRIYTVNKIVNPYLPFFNNLNLSRVWYGWISDFLKFSYEIFNILTSKSLCLQWI